MFEFVSGGYTIIAILTFICGTVHVKVRRIENPYMEIDYFVIFATSVFWLPVLVIMCVAGLFSLYDRATDKIASMF